MKYYDQKDKKLLCQRKTNKQKGRQQELNMVTACLRAKQYAVSWSEMQSDEITKDLRMWMNFPPVTRFWYRIGGGGESRRRFLSSSCWFIIFRPLRSSCTAGLLNSAAVVCEGTEETEVIDGPIWFHPPHMRPQLGMAGGKKIRTQLCTSGHRRHTQDSRLHYGKV